MSARSSKQHKVADSDRGNTGAPNKNKRIAKALSISRQKEPKLANKKRFFSEGPYSHGQRYISAELTTEAVVCQNVKKSPACANLRRLGLYSRIRLNSGVFVGGGLSGIFFPPLSACFKHGEPSRIVGDIPPLEETADGLTHLARSAAVWEVLLTETCRPAADESHCFGRCAVMAGDRALQYPQELYEVCVFTLGA